MNFARLVPIVFALIAVSSLRADEASLHGIRNEKCVASEEDAKSQILQKIDSDHTLCPTGSATQTGGWTCRAGRDCPKTKFRCNTQYACDASFESTARIPAPPPAVPTSAPAPVWNQVIRAFSGGGTAATPTPVASDEAPATATIPSAMAPVPAPSPIVPVPTSAPIGYPTVAATPVAAPTAPAPRPGGVLATPVATPTIPGAARITPVLPTPTMPTPGATR